MLTTIKNLNTFTSMLLIDSKVEDQAALKKWYKENLYSIAKNQGTQLES